MSKIPYDFAGKQLVLMVGLPYAGKTTRALELSKMVDAPIVNPDSVRLAIHGFRYQGAAEALVWWVTRMMVRALFLTGEDIVILDATNNTRKRRDDWRGPEGWQTSVVYVYAPAKVCLERAQAAGDDEIVPVIERMVAEHEPPLADEPTFVPAEV